MADLTPDEISFFDTGELPASMQAEADAAEANAAAVVVPPVEQEKVETVVEAPEVVTPKESTETLLQRFMDEERTRRAALEEQIKDLQTKLTEKISPKEQEPDEVSDPLGAMMHKLNQVNSQVAELQTKLTAEQQNNLLKQQFDQFTDSVRELKVTFEKTTPDFKDAYAHIRNVRTEDLRMTGMPESEIQQSLLKDELQLAQTAIQRGRNPAEEMYNMAKRYGYTPRSPKIVVDPDDKIAALQAGERAAKTVARAAGTTELTLAGLKDASSSDLNKLVQDDAMWSRVVGGTNNTDIF